MSPAQCQDTARLAHLRFVDGMPGVRASAGRWLVLLIAGLLAGCDGAPTHFYTLAATSPASSQAAACSGEPIAVNRVLLPDSLDRQSIVVMDGTDRVDISGQNRWAAPLDGMIQHVLAEDLRRRLPTGQVLMPGDVPPPGGTVGIDVNVLQFAGGAGGRVVLRADWTLINPQGKAAATRSEATTARTTSSATDDLVAAMSQALGDLADRMIAVLPDCRS